MGLSREESYEREDRQRITDEIGSRHYGAYELRERDPQELDAYCAAQMSPEELYTSCRNYLSLMKDIADGIQNSHYRSRAERELKEAEDIVLPDPANSQAFGKKEFEELCKYAPAFWRMTEVFQAWSDEDAGEV